MRWIIFGVPVTLDFSPPPTEKELAEAGRQYTETVNQCGEALDLYSQWSKRGYMPVHDPDDQTFSFVDADTYINTPPGESMG